MKTWMMIILAIVAFMVYQRMFAGKEASGLGKKLKDGGWVFYGREGCPWCTKQKVELGDLMASITYVDCGENPEECKKAKVEGVPFFSNGSVSFSGFHKKEDLANKVN